MTVKNEPRPASPFAFSGVLVVVAGLGDVMRRSWARLLAFGVAILAIL